MTLLSRRACILGLGSAPLALGSVSGATHAAPTNKIFVFANSSRYNTLDPHVVYDVARVASRINLYDGLMRWLGNPPELKPWLAEGYEISSDGKTYRFKLRKNATFHNGAPLTSADIVYSMERILALKQGAYSIFAPIIAAGSTKAIDRHTIEFNLTTPSAIFPSVTPEIYAANSELLKQQETNNDWGSSWLASNDAGGGSYELTEFSPATGFKVRTFKDHFMGPATIETVDFRGVIEANTRILGLMRGEFHGTDGYLPQDQIDKLRGSETISVLEEESMRVFHIVICNQRPPFTDVHFRRALSYAFDYNAFVNDLLKGAVVRNPGPIPNNMWGAPKDLAGFSHDLDKAKSELAKVTVPIRPLTITALAGLDQTSLAATLLQNNLRKIGLESKIEVVPWPIAEQRIRKLETAPDLMATFKSTSFADPHNWIGTMFSSKNWGSRNQGYYKNEKVDVLLDAALVATNQDERRAKYEDASRIVVEDAGAIFVSNSKWFGPFSKSVEGVRFCPVGDGQEMRWVKWRA
jgi:peptide/nickel transport system substrate-binding protein